MLKFPSPQAYGDLKDRMFEFLTRQHLKQKTEFARVQDLSDLTPPVIAANVNDYDPWAGEGEVNVLLLSTDANRNITGLATGRKNRKIHVFNVGGFNITLTNQDTLSVAANRIIVGTNANLLLTPDTAVGIASATLYYDDAATRWRVID